MSHKDSLDNLPKYRKLLANYWINSEVVGHSIKSISEDNLESDGRKRNKVISILARDGYLNMVDGRVQVTAKAFNEVVEDKPNFAQNLKDASDDVERLPSGFAWHTLPLEVRKYISTHRNEFHLFTSLDTIAKILRLSW